MAQVYRKEVEKKFLKTYTKTKRTEAKVQAAIVSCW